MRRRTVLASAAAGLAVVAVGETVRGEEGASQSVTGGEPLTQSGLEAMRRRAGAPALTVMARGPGGELALVSGVRRSSHETPATLDDLWHLGSITKSMTATLIALAVEAGELSWETTIEEALGDVAAEGREDYRPVTLRHLLSHRSGMIANVGSLRSLRFPGEEDDPRQSRIAYIRNALAQPPVGAPGEAFHYSNAGYVTAAAMLEARLDLPWETMIQERLFTPLGLASAGFGPPGRDAPDSQPWGHRGGFVAAVSGRRIAMNPGPGRRADNPGVLGPAGRVHMTLSDAITYAEAHRDRAGILTPASWNILHGPPFGGDYAMGWVVAADSHRWHNGSNTMWYAEVHFDPATGVVAAAASNDGVLSRSQPAVASAVEAAVAAVSG